MYKLDIKSRSTINPPKANTIKQKIIFKDDKEIHDRIGKMKIHNNMCTSDKEWKNTEYLA